MLQRFPDITVFFGRADALALKPLRPPRWQLRSVKIIVVGFDGDVAGLKAVESGAERDITQKTKQGQARPGKRAGSPDGKEVEGAACRGRPDDEGKR